MARRRLVVRSPRHAASDPTIALVVGLVLIVAIDVQIAILFGVYAPDEADR